ncbi:hypothetical protein HME9304_03214 [Flagellimonas maritima]|uniref:Lipoprotein n=1 Tax=Flagellimonas maritima TaxID=1383885 RepID=A0A2Z4LWJ5_9FLAO|nr:hypothetical protein [Allomuricauda aurantiaca]AWX46182.1 hypothetical protein HME9304_03214 [Allomuricauda aurantiaca]
MRANIKLSFLILLILTIIGCQNSVQNEKQLARQVFGKWQGENDSLGVELNIDQFKKWNDLLERTERIACNDSLPKITLTTENKLKTIYFRNPCWEDFACILIKQKNVIEIHNDTINKNDENFFPLDSLENVLKKDLENNGKNPKLSDNPEKLLIYISYDNKNGFKNLPNTLNQLTETYNRITNKTDIKLWLNEKIYFVPPPPPPMNEIELDE